MSAGVLALVLALGLAGCAWRYPGDSRRGPTPTQALASAVADWQVADTVAVLGFRDPFGKVPASAPVLDGALMSALARRGVTIDPAAGIALGEEAPRLSFAGSKLFPAGWRDLGGAQGRLVLAAQVRDAAPWVYLRLALADADAGVLRAVATTRVSQARLEQIVAAAAAAGTGGPQVLAPIEAQMHLIARRDEAGFARRIDVREQATLVEGDRLQVRLRTQQDCEAFIFLYASSDGQRQDLLSRQRIYGDRWNYAPGENRWITLDRGDEVYTLYVLVAPRIDEDLPTLWERLDKWQTEGRIDRMEGIDLIDDAVSDYLQRTITGIDSVDVLRGDDVAAETTGEVKFTYNDGAVLTSTAEVLRAPVLVRAISFGVRWR